MSRFALAAGLAALAVATAAPAQPPAAAEPVVTPPLFGTPALPDFSTLVERHGAAVVNIATLGRAPSTPQAGQGPRESDPNDPMLEFFRRFGIPGPEARPEPRQGVGSGFILSRDGYILTNAHVVADAAEVTVKLTDRREYRAKVVGADRRTDIAVLKIDAADLPVVRLGDPEALKVGEWVAAIGSPFGLENSVTAGIVSAKSRVLSGDSYVPFLQTDVAINPGNSGGPLFNMNGEVVGINSQIYSRTGGYMGLSFAVPIDVAIKVKDDLVRHGKVNRGRIGVAIQNVNRDLADSFGLDRPRGALVSGVEPNSPAQKAGLEPGDIILAANGRAIAESTELPRIVAETAPGTRLPFAVWRRGAEQTLTVEVGAMPADRVAALEGSSTPTPQAADRVGLAVRPLTPEEQKSAGVSAGLLVERAEGAAARAGIQRGDVILSLNNRPVSTVEELRRLTERSQGSVAVLVKRQDARLFLPLRIG